MRSSVSWKLACNGNSTGRTLARALSCRRLMQRYSATRCFHAELARLGWHRRSLVQAARCRRADASYVERLTAVAMCHRVIVLLALLWMRMRVCMRMQVRVDTGWTAGRAVLA